MKKLYSLAIALGISAFGISQSYSDDFESYSVGDDIGATTNWDAWSGSSGGADDVQVVDDLSNSGSNSIYLEAATAAGGPDDVVLHFGDKYETGQFTFEMMMYVPSGSGAYFNFQAETTVGQVWALDASMNQDGDIDISNTNGNLMSASYPHDVWTELSFVIDLNQNEWEFFVDGTSQGSFSNTINAIASLNLYAFNNNNGGNGVATFWVDDVSYDYTASTLPNDNGAVTGISSLNGLVGQVKAPTVTVRNLGVNNITSFDVDVAYDGNTITEVVTGMNMASYDEYEVEFTDEIILNEGANTLTATIKNVNGLAADDDPSDDASSITIDPTAPGLNKMVVVEEATGTWCGWCPRGAVWMERMQDQYPENFIGLAVHNGDPMVYSEYDEGIGTLISGYPSSVVDRGADIDPSVMEGDFLSRVVLDGSAAMCISAVMDETEMELTVTLKVSPTAELSDDWKVAIALSENDVTGTASDYAQANYYSGGASGELSGAGHDWHSASNPVPANQMEYDHVARLIAPGFTGMSDAFPDGGEIGEDYYFEFVLDIDEDWNLDNIHIISMLLNENGVIDNGYQIDYTNALPVDCSKESTGLNTVTVESNAITVYPNPAMNTVKISADMKAGVDNQLIVRDVMGRVVYSNVVSDNAGLYQLDLDISTINSGVYVVELHNGAQMHTAKFIKQ